MNHLNSVLIEGNITREPVLKKTSGDPVCTFVIASDRFYKKGSVKEKETGFFEIHAWGKLAVIAHSYGHKGRGIRVEGRLKHDRWNGPDGNQRSKIVIVAENLELRPENKKEAESEKV